MSLKKPKRPDGKMPFKAKALCKDVKKRPSVQAATNIKYEESPYHCHGPKGERPRFRTKPASPCPRKWSAQEAITALKRAIQLGWISDKRVNDFPRYIWYRDGETTIYEARSAPAVPGKYHAYPVEAWQVPKELKW
jgi:hypothetical protein